MLIAAFRATLEEVIEADVILHVRDVSHEDAEAQLHDVENILTKLGIDPRHEAQNKRILIDVWNKIDRLDWATRERLANIARRQPPTNRPVLVSATTEEGLDALAASIEARLPPVEKSLRSASTRQTARASAGFIAIPKFSTKRSIRMAGSQ